jgi:hypothetical protein
MQWRCNVRKILSYSLLSVAVIAAAGVVEEDESHLRQYQCRLVTIDHYPQQWHTDDYRQQHGVGVPCCR